jgi:hypothetical protein
LCGHRRNGKGRRIYTFLLGKAQAENGSVGAVDNLQFDLRTIAAFIVIFGFFGGAASYFSYCLYGSDGGFRDRFGTKFGPAVLFTILNGLIGIAGAFAIQLLLLGMRFYDRQPVASDFIYLAAVCLIGGFAARLLLGQVTQMFPRQIKQEFDEARQLLERTALGAEEQARQVALLALASDNASPQTLEFVIKTADAALKKNPNDATFVLAKSAALKRLKRFPAAIDTLNPYLQRFGAATAADKTLSTAFYNRASCLALLNRPELALRDLKRALELSDNATEDKQRAAADPDFANVRSNPQFTELVRA